MKIKKIKYKDHHILGNLELDFTKPNGEAYDTIIIAGENGTGKTTILETLNTFLNLKSFDPFESILYEINGANYTANNIGNDSKWGSYDREDSSGNKQFIHGQDNSIMDQDLLDIRHYGCIYSKARSGFTTGPVFSTTGQLLDISKYDEDIDDNFTNLKQLLVDISFQDDRAFAEQHRNGNALDYNDEFIKTSKLFRFSNAFNNFFENIEFYTIDDNFKILFKKGENKIEIDNLSTGEKQIVFRGAHLLKNSKSINGGTVIVDEPELSMHPMWQEKILDYYQNLFKVSGNQTVQLIMATHSEYLVRAGLEDKDNVLIVILNNNGGSIASEKIDTAKFTLPTITSAETNYVAFRIPSNDYHIELFGHLQNKTSCNTVKACDDHIAGHMAYGDTHAKTSGFSNPRTGQRKDYQTLPVFIRNAIDHPNTSGNFTRAELQTSIELLIELCK